MSFSQKYFSNHALHGFFYRHVVVSSFYCLFYCMLLYVLYFLLKVVSPFMQYEEKKRKSAADRAYSAFPVQHIPLCMEPFSTCCSERLEVPGL